MKFRAGELVFNASIAESNESRSPQTGEPLRSMTIQFRAQKAAMHELALAEAEQRQSGGLFSLGEVDDTPETEWRVRESRVNYVGSEPWGINHHLWRIEEVERLACEQLIVGTLTLVPYEYVEQVSDEGLVRLAARASVSDAELEVLSRLPGLSIEVRRVGISDTPRSMVLEGYVWGPRPSGLGAALTCVDVREPRVSLAGVEAVPGDDGAFEDLIAMLLARDVLSDEGVQELHERIRRRRHAARRVANVDTWSL